MSDFVTLEEGKSLRAHRRDLAATNYVPQHSPTEYLRWMEANTPFQLTLVHAQDRNHEEVFSVFTSASQYVYGDCIEECIDRAMVAPSVDERARQWAADMARLEP